MLSGFAVFAARNARCGAPGRQSSIVPSDLRIASAGRGRHDFRNSCCSGPPWCSSSFRMSAREIISFVIPVYRNEHAVTLTHQRTKEMLASQLPSYDYEFVFVDDGSDDNSLNELLEIRKSDPKVRVISFTRNFGQMAAIQAG